jgi:hypothetical protein
MMTSLGGTTVRSVVAPRPPYDLPDVIDHSDGSLYLSGSRYEYAPRGLACVHDVTIAKTGFVRCTGTWPVPLILIPGRKFTAEPQVSAAKMAMIFGAGPWPRNNYIHGARLENRCACSGLYLELVP